MFRNKLSVKNATSDYLVYSYPDIDRFRDLPTEGIVTVSIDIAIKNFALCIERRSNSCVQNLVFDRIDFSKNENSQEKSGTTAISPEILDACLEYLISKREILQQADLVCIERQLAENYKSSRMFQHTLSVVLAFQKFGWLKSTCTIIDINPKVKGNLLGMPKNLNYNGRKGWAIEKAKEILTERDDQVTLAVMLKAKGKAKFKGDDLADTVCQMEAWFKLINS